MAVVQVGVQVCLVSGAQAVDAHVNALNLDGTQVVLQPGVVLGDKVGVGIGLEHKQVIAVAASDGEMVALHVAVKGHDVFASAEADAGGAAGNITVDIHVAITSAHHNLVGAVRDIAVQREDVVAIAHVEGVFSVAQVAVDFDVVIAAAGIDGVGSVVAAADIARKRDAVAVRVSGLAAALNDIGGILDAVHGVGLSGGSGLGRDDHRKGLSVLSMMFLTAPCQSSCAYMP